MVMSLLITFNICKVYLKQWHLFADAALYKLTSDVISQELHGKEIYQDPGTPQSVEED